LALPPQETLDTPNRDQRSKESPTEHEQQLRPKARMRRISTGERCERSGNKHRGGDDQSALAVAVAAIAQAAPARP
jgi:hypothetical protein